MLFRSSMDRDKLKLIVRNLKLLIESLESEVFSDIDLYKEIDRERIDMYSGGSPLNDYDEVFDDDDGYPD